MMPTEDDFIFRLFYDFIKYNKKFNFIDFLFIKNNKNLILFIFNLYQCNNLKIKLNY
jgi:hypothetical protein